jgi:hypothetical protein
MIMFGPRICRLVTWFGIVRDNSERRGYGLGSVEACGDS